MQTALIALAAYLLGSVSFAIVTSKVMRLPDPRSYGSGNPGATNVLRSGSRLAAALTKTGRLDPKAADSTVTVLRNFLSIAAGYGVNAYPNLWMIDPQGRIASHHVGYGEDSLNAIIDEVKRLLTIEMERRQAIGASPAAAG